MTRFPLFLLAALGTAALLLTAGLPCVVPCVAAPAESGNDPVTDLSGLQLQGVGSCSAAACHGYNGPKGSKGSEYTTWAGPDKHSRASSTDTTDTSAIIWPLTPGMGASFDP